MWHFTRVVHEVKRQVAFLAAFGNLHPAGTMVCRRGRDDRELSAEFRLWNREAEATVGAGGSIFRCSGWFGLATRANGSPTISHIIPAWNRSSAARMACHRGSSVPPQKFHVNQSSAVAAPQVTATDSLALT